ncbi:MAG: acylphosphatase [Gammaproteobacteria bacterium]
MNAGNVTRAIRYVIAGRVQGVYYRAATAARAQHLQLRGSVRNLADGRVEVIAAGSDVALRELATWLWHGSPAARVDGVHIEEWLEFVNEGFVVTA